MTSWVDSLWQMVGVWKGQERRRAERQGGPWLHREEGIPAARAMQQLPSFRPGDEEEERAGVARLAAEAAARARAARARAAGRQMMPGYRPGDPVRGDEAQQQLFERLQRDRELQEDWQRQLDARDPGTARLRREAPPSGTPEHAEWLRWMMSS